MTDIRITQLCPAPADLWRFHALIESDAPPGDAIVYISRVLALALIEDERNLKDGAPQWVAPIHAGEMAHGVEEFECGWPSCSCCLTEVAHAANLAEALELAEKWWRKVFHRGLAGHDIAATIQAKGMNTWEIAGGACASGCPRCTVERTDEERQV